MNLDIKTVDGRPTSISVHLPLDRRGRLGHNGRQSEPPGAPRERRRARQGPVEAEYHRLQEESVDPRRWLLLTVTAIAVLLEHSSALSPHARPPQPQPVARFGFESVQHLAQLRASEP